MKNLRKLIVMCMFMFTLISASSVAFAQNVQPSKIDGVEVYIDGTELETKESFYNFNGGTLVPMRELFEGLGAELSWDGSTQTIVAKTDEQTIELTINKKTAQINGKEKALSVEPKIINEHTYVPLRFIAEALRYEVDWNGSHKIIRAEQ